MKWKQKLSEFGLNEANLSQGVKAKVRDYYKIENGVKELERQINSGEIDDSERDELESELNDLKDSLSEYDKFLVKSIEVFNKNKDKYAEVGKKLLEGKKRKQEEKEKAKGGEATPTPSESQTPSVTPLSNKDVANMKNDGDEPKKKSGVGWLIFAVAAGIITLGAVNVLKNND